MKGLMSRRGIDRLIALVALALMVVLPIPALAQPTQALVENWRDTDFGLNSSMFDTNVDGDASVLGSIAATNIPLSRATSFPTNLKITRQLPLTVIAWNPLSSPVKGCRRHPGAPRLLGFVAASSAVSCSLSLDACCGWIPALTDK